jgi:hypothetical protein
MTPVYLGKQLILIGEMGEESGNKEAEISSDLSY